MGWDAPHEVYALSSEDAGYGGGALHLLLLGGLLVSAVEVGLLGPLPLEG